MLFLNNNDSQGITIIVILIHSLETKEIVPMISGFVLVIPTYYVNLIVG